VCHSDWTRRLSDTLPEVFAPPPEILPGFMREEAEAAIARRAPVMWEFIRGRNIFGGPLPPEVLAQVSVRPQAGLRRWLMSFLRRRLFDKFGRS
jgi:tRNA(adenine34) deaminase